MGIAFVNYEFEVNGVEYGFDADHVLSKDEFANKVNELVGGSKDYYISNFEVYISYLDYQIYNDWGL